MKQNMQIRVGAGGEGDMGVNEKLLFLIINREIDTELISNPTHPSSVRFFGLWLDDYIFCWVKK